MLTQLYLADMAHFAAVNAGYRRHFPMVKPAARACVQLPLPQHCPLVVHVLVARQGLPLLLKSRLGTVRSEIGHYPAPPSRFSWYQSGPSLLNQVFQTLGQKLRRYFACHAAYVYLPRASGLQGCRVLHVQSISRWAPSCIGPYSQAVATPGLTFFAGQIGLDPPTMALLPSLQQQVRQCFAGCQVGVCPLWSSPTDACACHEAALHADAPWVSSASKVCIAHNLEDSL